MPGVQENEEVWEQTWDWSREGEEWSDWWGGSRAMWLAALLPRLDPFLPAGRILEIAPGFGRWTRFLKDQCDDLVLVDLTERCLEHCRKRFAEENHIEFFQNDGRSLAMVEDASIDLAFSFDSLVHVESDVIDAYLAQLASKLTRDGVGFIHHSNTGSYRVSSAIARRAPTRYLDALIRRGLVIDISAWRAESVTGKFVAESCERAGLIPIAQELISWEHGPYLTDAITTVTLPGSKHARSPQRLKNPFFGSEGRRMKRMYATSTSP